MRTLRTPTVAERPIRGKVTGGAPRNTYLVRLPLGPQAPLPNSLSGCRAFVLARLLRGHRRRVVVWLAMCVGKTSSTAINERRLCWCTSVLVLSTACQCHALSIVPIAVLAFVSYVKVAGCFGPFVMNRYALCVRHTVERVNICAIRNHIAEKMSKLL